MSWMNRSDIEYAVERYAQHPVLARATVFLRAHMYEANAHSDGWHSWPLPSNAAKQLMEMIQAPGTATEATLRKALIPIKSFYTRRGNQAGMVMPRV